jgi:hypothetical protein
VLCQWADAQPANPTPAEQDEAILKQASVGSDEAALLQFFRERTLTDQRRAEIMAVIVFLGSESFEVREKASTDLKGEGIAVVSLLRQVITASDTDIEVVRRAEAVLEALKAPSSNVSAAAARLLAQKKAAAAAATLLAFLPFADDELVADEVRRALVGVAVRDGIADKALVRALDDKLPLRRGAAVEALVRAGTAEQRQGLRKFLHDPDAGVRLQTALSFVDHKDKEAVPVLIGLLADLPHDRAWQAEEVLCRLAGEKMPSVPLGRDAASQKKCSAAWNEWWTRHGADLDLAKLDDTPRLLGYTLIVQIDPANGVGRVLELDAAKQVRWRIDGLHYPVDAQVIRHDRVLIAEYNGQRVSERNFKGDIVWEKRIQAPINAQRLPNGSTFIACHNQLVIVDGQGKEVFGYQRPNHDIMTAVRQRDGQFVFITNGGLAIRIDAAGKETKSFATGYVHQFGGIDALPGGKILVPQTSTSKVVEFDADGKAGWSASAMQPTSAVRLPSGNTLVASFNSQKLVELDAKGSPVWEYKCDGRPSKARKR